MIAEGVESLEQRDALLRADCHFFQGNFFSPPLPAEPLELLLRNPHAPQSPSSPRPA